MRRRVAYASLLLAVLASAALAVEGDPGITVRGGRVALGPFATMGSNDPAAAPASRYFNTPETLLAGPASGNVTVAGQRWPIAIYNATTTIQNGTCVGDPTPSTCEFDFNDLSAAHPQTDTGGSGGASRGGVCSDGFLNFCWCDAHCKGIAGGMATPIAANCPASQPNCGSITFAADPTGVESVSPFSFIWTVTHSGNTSGTRTVGNASFFNALLKMKAEDTWTSGTDLTNNISSGFSHGVQFVKGNDSATGSAGAIFGYSTGITAVQGWTVGSYAGFNYNTLRRGPCTCDNNDECDIPYDGLGSGVAGGVCDNGQCVVGRTTCTADSECSSSPDQETCLSPTVTGPLDAYTVHDQPTGIGTPTIRGYRCLLNASGSDRFCYHAAGTAPFVMAGKAAIGSTTAPTAQLEVVGASSLANVATLNASGSVTGDVVLLGLGNANVSVGSGGALWGVRAAGTTTITGNPSGFGLGNFFEHKGTIRNADGAGANDATNVTIAGWSPFAHATTYLADDNTGAMTLTDVISPAVGTVFASPQLLAEEGGTGTAATVAGLTFVPGVDTGWAVTTAAAGRALDPTGSGTITNLVGWDCGTLTRGGTTSCVRSAVAASSGRYFLRGTGSAQSVIGGKVAINSTTDPVEALDVTGHVRILASGGTAQELRFLEPSGSEYAAIKAPSLAANTIYTLPIDDGSAGEVLSSDGSGGLDWVPQSGAVTMTWFLDGFTNCGSSPGYLGIGNACSTTEADVDYPVAANMTVKEIHCAQLTDTTCTLVATVRKNGADQTAIQCTITNVGGCTDNDATGVSFSAGDTFSIELDDTGANCSANVDAGCAVEVTAP